MYKFHIIEPTLKDYRGHCHSFNTGICSALKQNSIEPVLWLNKDAEVEFDSGIEQIKFFHKTFRRLQFLWVIRSLLNKGERVFIPTCTLVDLQILSWIVPKKQLKNISVFIHWFKPKQKRVKRLRKCIKRLGNLHILVPTTSMFKLFNELGFSRVQDVPYPVENTKNLPEIDHVFKSAIYSGAARVDKGFVEVSSFLRYLENNSMKVPIQIQTTLSHSNACPDELKEALATIINSDYPYLKKVEFTNSTDAYMQQFIGGISLMFYDSSDFQDRISGVALDSFLLGAPIICNEGHWIAKQVLKYDAGFVVKSTNPKDVLFAVEKVIKGYHVYSTRAYQAGKKIILEHSPENIVRELFTETR